MDDGEREVKSAVKRAILRRLTGGDWVSSKELLKLTKQKYFDRRIRELRDENGFDIETGFRDGEPHYRLRSANRQPSKPRSYLSVSDKKKLIAQLGAKCGLCGREFKDGIKMVFDHRTPLLRGGAGVSENFQLLCYDCNNQKRSQCRGCTYDCNKCYFAFPDKFPVGVVLRPLDRDFWLKVESASISAGLPIEEFIIHVLKREFKTK